MGATHIRDLEHRWSLVSVRGSEPIPKDDYKCSLKDLYVKGLWRIIDSQT